MIGYPKANIKLCNGLILIIIIHHDHRIKVFNKEIGCELRQHLKTLVFNRYTTKRKRLGTNSLHAMKPMLMKIHFRACVIVN